MGTWEEIEAQLLKTFINAAEKTTEGGILR
jgi:hypothetical protein